MSPPPSLPRLAALVVGAALLCSCAATTTPKAATPSGVPSFSSVVAGRFVTPVRLDHGALTIEPPGTTRPHVSAKRVEAMFRATQVVEGTYPFSIFGLADVTVSPPVAVPTTTAPMATTTTPGPSATSEGTAPVTTAATTTSTTTTTTMPTTTTTASTGGTAPTTSTTLSAPPPAAALPRYDSRLAWVGIAWGVSCPVRAGTTRLPIRYVAVVFDARTGGGVLAYTSRGVATCRGPVQPPSVSRPAELVSVPWQPVGPTSTAVRVTMPACSTYYGWTDVPGPSPPAIEVVAQAPFDPVCGSSVAQIAIVDAVVPLGSAQTLVPHAALGPIDALRSLAGG